MRRPDLHVFVNMGDGDCCSIGTAHWIHAIRMNMNLVAMLHDNNIYGLTKNQVSPTTPVGRRTATTPYGAHLKAMNPLTVTLGGIAEKPGVVDGRIEIREYLCVTVSFDHDIIDGAPAARFTRQFRELVESGYGLGG